MGTQDGGAGRELELRQGQAPAVAGRQEALGERLLHTSPETARAVIRHAAAVAKVFAEAIREAGLVEVIDTKQGPKPFTKELGWELLGNLLGAHVDVDEPEPYDLRNRPDAQGQRNPLAYGWRARATVWGDGGQVLAADWGVCLRTESRWTKADDYAVMGMAGTRAARRALTRALGWIVALAGLEPTMGNGEPPVPAQEQKDEQKATRTRRKAKEEPDPADGDPGPERPPDPPAAEVKAEPEEDVVEGEAEEEPESAPEASDEGRMRADQVARMARKRGIEPEALQALLVEAGLRWPASPAYELGADEDRYTDVLTAVAGWTPVAP